MFGKFFRVSIFGESHGQGVGVLIEGVPPGLRITEEYLYNELKRRAPGKKLVSPRKEEDKPVIISGVFNGRTTGAPLLVLVYNRDVDSSFYEEIRGIARPGHADYVAWKKYLGFNDYRGGGIFSGRRTVGITIAGAIAKEILKQYGIRVYSYLKQLGTVYAKNIPESQYELERFLEKSVIRCPDEQAEIEMINHLREIIKKGDSLGGIVETVVFNLPVGLGEPPADGIDSDLAKILLAIPGVKGVEFGLGFKLAELTGSQANDELYIESGKVLSKTNNMGGIIGGLTNGMPLLFRVVFKPTSTIRKEQKTVDYLRMKDTTIKGKGRHDPSIALRGTVVVEAATSIVLADHILRWSAWRNLPWID